MVERRNAPRLPGTREFASQDARELSSAGVRLPRRAGALVPGPEAHAPDRGDTQGLDAEQTHVPDRPRSPSPTPSELAAPAARGARPDPAAPPPAGARHHPRDLDTHPHDLDTHPLDVRVCGRVVRPWSLRSYRISLEVTDGAGQDLGGMRELMLT